MNRSTRGPGCVCVCADFLIALMVPYIRVRDTDTEKRIPINIGFNTGFNTESDPIAMNYKHDPTTMAALTLESSTSDCHLKQKEQNKKLTEHGYVKKLSVGINESEGQQDHMRQIIDTEYRKKIEELVAAHKREKEKQAKAAKDAEANKEQDVINQERKQEQNIINQSKIVRGEATERKKRENKKKLEAEAKKKAEEAAQKKAAEPSHVPLTDAVLDQRWEEMTPQERKDYESSERQRQQQLLTTSTPVAIQGQNWMKFNNIMDFITKFENKHTKGICNFIIDGSNLFYDDNNSKDRDNKMRSFNTAITEDINIQERMRKTSIKDIDSVNIYCVIKTQTLKKMKTGGLDCIYDSINTMFSQAAKTELSFNLWVIEIDVETCSDPPTQPCITKSKEISGVKVCSAYTDNQVLIKLSELDGTDEKDETHLACEYDDMLMAGLSYPKDGISISIGIITADGKLRNMGFDKENNKFLLMWNEFIKIQELEYKIRIYKRTKLSNSYTDFKL